MAGMQVTVTAVLQPKRGVCGHLKCQWWSRAWGESQLGAALDSAGPVQAGNSLLVSTSSAHICLWYKSKKFIKGQNKLAKGNEANAAGACESQASQMEQ